MSEPGPVAISGCPLFIEVSNPFQSKWQEGIKRPCVDLVLSMEIKALMENAHRFARIGRYDEAIACYDKVLEIDGKNTTALENKGKIYYSLGRVCKDAITLYDKALAINNNLASAGLKRVYPAKNSTVRGSDQMF